jgi:hypothetical protein
LSKWSEGAAATERGGVVVVLVGDQDAYGYGGLQELRKENFQLKKNFDNVGVGSGCCPLLGL